jgi:hypothetical protein
MVPVTSSDYWSKPSTLFLGLILTCIKRHHLKIWRRIRVTILFLKLFEGCWFLLGEFRPTPLKLWIFINSSCVSLRLQIFILILKSFDLRFLREVINIRCWLVLVLIYLLCFHLCFLLFYFFRHPFYSFLLFVLWLNSISRSRYFSKLKILLILFRSCTCLCHSLIQYYKFLFWILWFFYCLISFFVLYYL